MFKLSAHVSQSLLVILFGISFGIYSIGIVSEGSYRCFTKANHRDIYYMALSSHIALALILVVGGIYGLTN